MPTRKLANPLWAFAFPTIGAALTIIAAVVAAAAARRLHRHHRRGLCHSRSPAGTFTLGYWDIRGLAAPARMMLAYRGVAFEDRTYSLQPQESGGWQANKRLDCDHRISRRCARFQGVSTLTPLRHVEPHGSAAQASLDKRAAPAS